jgi:hypothetical protein
MYLLAQASGDASGFDAIARSGFSNQGVTDLMTNWWVRMQGLYKPTDTVFGNALLEGQFLGSYVPLYAESNTVVPTGSAVREKAAGTTYFMKSTDNIKMPVALYEMSMGIPNKYIAYGSIDTVNQGILDGLANAGGTAGPFDPWAWRVSRNATYCARWLSLITDTNEKLRRRRGIK